MISEKIIIRPVPSKGVGVIALESIEAGELLMSERPLIELEDWSPEHLLSAWSSLSRENKVKLSS